MTDDSYFRVVLGQEKPLPDKIEVTIEPLTLPAMPAPFYTTLVNRLVDAGIPIKPHTLNERSPVLHQIRDNVTKGKLEWVSWDFGKAIRFTWTKAT